MVYDSTEDTNKLDHDDSFVRELFASDSESEFEGFLIWKTLKIELLQNASAVSESILRFRQFDKIVARLDHYQQLGQVLFVKTFIKLS